MGRDKALLPLPGGQLLWQRQLAVLQQLAPAEIFVSGPRRPGFPATLEDRLPGLGPLAGVTAALEAMTTPRLLALAVDLPGMTAPFLARLLARPRGAVPAVDGRLEPLAAVYPASVLPLARQHLASADRSLQRLARAAGLDVIAVAPGDSPLFVNWNHPADYNLQRPA